MACRCQYEVAGGHLSCQCCAKNENAAQGVGDNEKTRENRSMSENRVPQILDPCCGSKMMWFDREDPRAMFCDVRAEEHTLCDGRVMRVNPRTVADFRNIPFPDASFNLIAFDPPHLNSAGKKSWIRKKYGALNRLTWSEDLSKGFDECWRVLKPGGTLIFKWNETQIKLRDVLRCFSKRPAFGHTTTHNLKTHWIVFYKWENI